MCLSYNLDMDIYIKKINISDQQSTMEIQC